MRKLHHGPDDGLGAIELEIGMLDDRPGAAEDPGRALHRRRPAGGLAHPVRASGLELSPATIRNVMADLEELGLIVSPHLGRPHAHGRGYRLFVDTMLTAQRAQLRRPSCPPSSRR
jgi:hypothetical protein